MDAKQTLVPCSPQNSMNAWLTNWVPLSVMILLGTPNLVKILRCTNFCAAVEVTVVKGSASIHLVNVAMALMRNLNPPGAVGNGPSKLSPQVANGQDKGIVCKACVG